MSAREDGRRALHALDLMLRWSGGVIPLRVSTGRHVETAWHDGTGDLARRVQALDERLSAEVLIGLPRRARDSQGVAGATVLWAVIESPAQLKKAQRFHPRPTLALAEGESSRRTLVWMLSERLDYYAIRQANRRLAYRFGAVQARGEPDEFWIPAPGTFLRVGRRRPCPVKVARLGAEPALTARQIVGRLKDPPEFDLREVLAKQASAA